MSLQKFNNKLLKLSSTTIRTYKSFKWVLSGRWNQGSGNSGATATYMEWDELGIGINNNSVNYGPTYWSYDSYTLNGTPWAPSERMPAVLLNGNRNTEYSKFDASSFVELTVYFHTTNNNYILPTSVGLISANNQNYYQSSTPLHFMLYGLNEATNEYELLIDVGAANVTKTDNAETIINSGFTYYYDTNYKILDVPSSSSIVTFYTRSEPIAITSGGRLTTNINVDISSRDYFVMKFDMNWPSSSSAYDLDINFNTGGWSCRLHNLYKGNYAPVWNGSNQVTQIVDNNVTCVSQDGTNNYYSNRSIPTSANYDPIPCYYKLIYQLSTGEVHIFLKYTANGPYVEQVVGNKTAGGTTFASISLVREQSSGSGMQISNIYAAGANTYQECLDY